MRQAVGYVYAIENTVNNRCYIGSATDYKSRWHTHRSSLRRGKHHSFILQRAWDKYGEGAFAFKVLVICAKEQRIEYENRLMPLQSYNVLRTAKEQLVRGGWHHTEEFRQKMAGVHKGKALSAEHRQKLADAARKRVYDAASRKKARDRQLKLLSSDAAHKQALYEAGEKARKLKSEACAQRARLAHEAILSGLTLQAACKQYKIAQETFYKHTKSMSLPLSGHASRIKKVLSANSDKAKSAYEALKTGETINNACKNVGIATNTLYRYMQKFHLPKIGHQNRKQAV
jgi:group I intron endonuclease